MAVNTPPSDLPVAGFGGDNVTDAAAGIGDVAGVTRDYVEMELGNGLAGGRAVVETKIESIWCRREL